MNTFKSFVPEIYEVNEQTFARIALDVFHFQAQRNPLYGSFIRHLRINPASISRIEDIPFLPIRFFKTHEIQTGEWQAERIFTTSGTTGSTPGRHLVYSVDDYRAHAQRCFERFFGSVKDFHFLALLPSYLERTGSSLIAMIDHFIRASGSDESGFYLHDHISLTDRIERLKGGTRKVILWGVSFALLDLAAGGSRDFSQCLVFETGGMKGRRKEITRQELHDTVKQSFNVDKVFSEYGMTELFSQAYTMGGLRFHCPPAMQVIGRELSDPASKGIIDETCGLNVIDLANWRTLSFIETEDVGRVFDDGSFEVTGRMDNSEVRGCNLMI